MIDSEKQIFDYVSYSKLVSEDQAIKHQGDNLTGEGDGDDEQIWIDLDKVNLKIQSIWPVITVYS